MPRVYPIRGNKCLMLSRNRIGIILTKGQLAVIDASSFKQIAKHTWCARYNAAAKVYNATRSVSTGTPYMHRYLMGVTDPCIEVDHRNHDTLDNTLDNLRIASRSENQCNKRGVSKLGIRNITYYPEIKQWRVRVRKDKKCYWKYFVSIFDALDYRDELLAKYHKEFTYVEQS